MRLHGSLFDYSIILCEVGMALWILRAFFLLVAIGLGLSVASNSGFYSSVKIIVFLTFLVGAALVIAADIALKRKRIDLISSVYFGLAVCLFLTYVVSLVLTHFFRVWLKPKVLCR